MAAVIRKIAVKEPIFMKFYMPQYFDLKSSNLTFVLGFSHTQDGEKNGGIRNSAFW